MQNGVSGYLRMLSLKLWRTKSTTYFYQGRPTTASRLVEFVYPLYKQRYERWTQTARSSDVNVSFKHYGLHT